MTNPKAKPETDQDLVDALATLLESEEDGEQAEFVDEELRAAGYDPAALGARVARVADEAYARSPYNWRQRAAAERAQAEARLRDRATERERRSRSEILEQINVIIARAPDLGESTRVQAHFRNLDQATDDDLDDLLTELEFLEDAGLEQED